MMLIGSNNGSYGVYVKTENQDILWLHVEFSAPSTRSSYGNLAESQKLAAVNDGHCFQNNGNIVADESV